MDAQTWLIIGTAALGVVVLAAAALWLWRGQRRRKLRRRFGDEYDHAVSETGDRSRAESILRQRERRIEALDIRPLGTSERLRFLEEWNEVQVRFVDSPEDAVFDADRLVTEVIRSKGYPTNDLRQRIEDVSVDYTAVISDYREACRIVALQQQGEADTEDQRRAMILYRSLFNELLNTGGRDEELRRAS